jgi:hypothetical protein
MHNGFFEELFKKGFVGKGNKVDSFTATDVRWKKLKRTEGGLLNGV